MIYHKSYILYKKNKLIPPISEEANKLLNYFTLKKFKKNYHIKEKEDKELVKLNKTLINEFESFSQKIRSSQISDEKFNNLIDEMAKFIHFLKIYNVIFIPFLGQSNVGKSIIINGIIGKEILPTYSKECTKRGIIIGYSNSDEISKYIKLIL